jgi:hypothetical protein
MFSQESKDLLNWCLEIQNNDKVKNKYQFMGNKSNKCASLQTTQKGTPHRRLILTQNNINLVNNCEKFKRFYKC